MPEETINFSDINYLVVGSGFWGATFAQKIASVLDKKVLVIDKRNHFGGNCFSEIDSETQIEYHKYGSHIFHTSYQDVWEFVNQFGNFNNYKHKVLTTFKHKVYSMPINLSTINSFYSLNLIPEEAKNFIDEEIKKARINNPKNLEEKAISLIGKELYEAFVKGYTQKQWGIEPKYLPPEIITRLPVRFNYDFHYFSDRYEGIPVEGYGKLFENMLSHKNIEVKLNTNYKEIKSQIPTSCKVIYTGMVDELFDYKYGQLGWKSLEFKLQRQGVKDFQGTSVMNFSNEEIPYTRCHEFKHLHPERKGAFDSSKTVVSFEYPKSYEKGDDAYYPVNSEKNNEIYEKYKNEINQNPNLIVGGRLGAYQYWDMDKTIKNALDTFYSLVERREL